MHSSASDLPTDRDIKRIRHQIGAWKRSIVWSDSSNSLLSRRLADDVATPSKRVRRQSIITDCEPIDIHAPPEATPLISTTASVQDYCDVPNSLSFIR
jgi:hypothetical protein